MKRIAFINSKGGCGKSTSLFHIAGVLADNDLKILIMDLDKQGDITNALLNEDKSNYNSDKDLSILDFLKGASFDDAVKKNYIRIRGNSAPLYKGIDVLPADEKLENQAAVKSVLNTGVKDRIKEIGNRYDFLLIDCPPSNRAIERLVLEEITDNVIVPMSSDLDSVRGYNKLVNKVQKAREINENIKVIGLFYSMFNKQRDTERQLRELMLDTFDRLFIDIQIPDTSALIDSKINGRPISFYKKHKSKEILEDLTQEIINRTE